MKTNLKRSTRYLDLLQIAIAEKDNIDISHYAVRVRQEMNNIINALQSDECNHTPEVAHG